ncbi:MAG: hypothetical protein U0T73_11400 [Chitinophagales bacterium]
MNSKSVCPLVGIRKLLWIIFFVGIPAIMFSQSVTLTNLTQTIDLKACTDNDVSIEIKFNSAFSANTNLVIGYSLKKNNSSISTGLYTLTVMPPDFSLAPNSSGTGYEITYTSSQSFAAGEVLILPFKVHPKCGLIPNNSVTAPAFQQNITVLSSGLTINSAMHYPILTCNSTANQNYVPGQLSDLKSIFQNTGDSEFKGNVTVTLDIHCPDNFQVMSSAKIILPSSISNQPINVTLVPDPVITGRYTFSRSFANTPIPPHEEINFVFSLKHQGLTSITPTCLNAPCQVSVTAAWTCESNSSCIFEPNCSFTFTNPVDPKAMTVSRILPADNEAWDNSCIGASQNWKFLIQNTCAVKNAYIQIYDLFPQLDYLDVTDIEVQKVDGDLNPISSYLFPAAFDIQSIGHKNSPYSVNDANGRLKAYYKGLGDLAADDLFILQFKTTRVCPANLVTTNNKWPQSLYNYVFNHFEVKGRYDLACYTFQEFSSSKTSFTETSGTSLP